MNTVFGSLKKPYDMATLYKLCGTNHEEAKKYINSYFVKLVKPVGFAMWSPKGIDLYLMKDLPSIFPRVEKTKQKKTCDCENAPKPEQALIPIAYFQDDMFDLYYVESNPKKDLLYKDDDDMLYINLTKPHAYIIY